MYTYVNSVDLTEAKLDMCVHFRLAFALVLPARSRSDVERSSSATLQTQAFDAAQSHHRDLSRAGLSGGRDAEGALSRLHARAGAGRCSDDDDSRVRSRLE